MSSDTEVLKIDEPHCVVRVYESSLRISFKGSVKDEIEVPLSDIDSAQRDGKGKTTIKLPRRKDVVIQLKPENAKKLVDKLNQLAPGKKEKAREQIFSEQKSQRFDNAEREYDREALSSPTGGVQSAMPPPPGVRREEKKAEKQEEKRSRE